MNLREMAAAIQIGSSRAKVDDFQNLPAELEASVEKKVLLEFATIDLMLRSGANSAQGLDPIPDSPSETRRVAVASTEPLLEALAEDSNAVIEWAREAEKRGLVAPPLALPGIIQAPKRIRGYLLPVLGQRGRWLAALMAIDLEEEETTLLEQAQADPARFRDFLAQEYEGMSWQQRADAIRCLAISLSHLDVPFLEAALNDKRKEVREAAYSALVQVLGSSQSQEISQLASPLLNYSKSMFRKSLQVEPPEPDSLPKNLPRSGNRAGFGPKALALYDVVRFTSPASWQESAKVSPSELMDMAGKTEYTDALLFGWMEAGLRFGDREWIDATFRHVRQAGFLMDFEHWPLLVRRVSERVFDEVAFAKLDAGELGPFLVSVGSNRGGPLSPQLSTSIARALPLMPSSHVAWRELGYLLDISALGSLSTPDGADDTLTKNLDRLRKTVDLRARLLRSLESL